MLLEETGHGQWVIGGGVAGGVIVRVGVGGWWATGNGQRVVGNGRREMGNRRREMGSGGRW